MSGISKALNKLTDKLVGIDASFNSAILLAAGSGTRATGRDGLTKQLTPLRGIPVIVRTVSIFESCSFINEIILVVKEEELPLYKDFIKTYRWKKISAVVKGGETRQLSVLEGFKKISDKSDYVYIHDGARCLITEEKIASVGHAAVMHGAAFASHRAHDTVRIESERGLSAVDRNRVYLAQTPQVFRTELFRAAAYSTAKKGISVTDDVMLAEAAGFHAVPVECGTDNLKITYPMDFALAEAILSFREAAKEGKT